ncbi:MAG TPA: hypothetical protein ENJ09_07890 [Planctomycetes bacterium]|nr:hypothetical protein [Planctomycetota bacterium]
MTRSEYSSAPPLKNLRVLLAQTNPRLGDVGHNLEEHLSILRQAREARADLAIFPELSLTGYFLKDQTFEVAMEPGDPTLARIAEASRDASVIAGFVERDRGGRLYNALGFFEGGELRAVHRKVHLVSYGMFDETRDFAAGDSFRAFEGEKARIGPLLCEDMWHLPSAYLHFLDEVDVISCSSASPARGVEAGGQGLASERSWELILRAQALLLRTFVVYVDRVGWEDGIGFGGGSCVVGPTGDVLLRMDALEPGTAIFELDGNELRRARFETPLRRDERPSVLAAGLAVKLPGWHLSTEGDDAR